MKTFALTQNNYDLHRKGQIDQARHKERVDEAIKENLADIIADESIITSDGKDIVKVPVRSLDEYRFRHDLSDKQYVGQGGGDSQVGDIIGYSNKKGSGQGQQGGSKGGDQAGEEYYEAAIDVEQLAALVFEDLGLPDLRDKQTREIETETIQFTDVRKKGSMSNLDKRRTIRENLKRNAQLGNPRFADVNEDDLRFKTWEPQVKLDSSAVVFAMADVSGSMGVFEKYICRAFFWWMVKFLRSQYTNVEIVFISHHTEAKIVTEHQFFHRGESGGTKASSAYELAVKLTESEYIPSQWNIYPFHFSDGDNFMMDNEYCVQLLQTLVSRCNQVGYGEIRQRRETDSELMKAFNERVTDSRFKTVVIKEKKDVWTAMQHFFTKDAGSRQAA